MKKYWKIWLLTAITCLAMNIASGNPIFVSIANTVLFLGYTGLFFEIFFGTGVVKFLPLIAFMPIFSLNHLFSQIYAAEIVILFFSFIFIKTKNKKITILLGVVYLFVYLYFSLLSNHLMKFPLKIERERFIYPQEPYLLEINRQRQESTYIPYRLRILTFNKVTVYGYVWMGSIFTYLSIETLYRTVLLVNAIFIIIGVFFLAKLKPKFRFLIISSGLISLFLAGLIKGPDSMRPLSSLRGILLLLTLNGIKHKLNWAVYLILFLTSMLINFVIKW